MCPGGHGYKGRLSQMEIAQARLQQTQTCCVGLSPVQRRYLVELGDRINRLGANLAVFSTDGDVILLSEQAGFRSAVRYLSDLARQLAQDRHPQGQVKVFSGPTTALGCVLEMTDKKAVLMVDLGEEGRLQVRSGLSVAASQAELRAMRRCLTELLGCVSEAFGLVCRSESETQQISSELAQAYEQLVLLQRLGTHMVLTENDKDFLGMICLSITEFMLVQGIAVILNDGQHGLSVAAVSGQVQIDRQQTGLIVRRLLAEIDAGKDFLLDGRQANGPRYDWPDTIESILAVPLYSKEPGSRSQPSQLLGAIVAINSSKSGQFDSTDVNLLSSVAGGCGVFVANGRLFRELKDLLLGLLVALAQSIDAKDEYTRGHSERVAFISRWIAEQMCRRDGLDKNTIHEAYFAGLLHDIGKIGVEDWILRKDSSLNDKEWLCVRRHPVISAAILRQIRQMQQILPAVMSHHERVDGSGYPQGLRSDQIPLLAKIVGLADSLDAMTSKRSYRPAKALRQAIDEIVANTGTQFDPEVASALLSSDIDRLWDLLGKGADQLHLGQDYPAAAVEALIR